MGPLLAFTPVMWSTARCCSDSSCGYGVLWSLLWTLSFFPRLGLWFRPRGWVGFQFPIRCFKPFRIIKRGVVASRFIVLQLLYYLFLQSYKTFKMQNKKTKLVLKPLWNTIYQSLPRFNYKGISSRTIQFDLVKSNLIFLGAQGSKLNHQAKFLSIVPLQTYMDFLGLLSNC